MKETQIHLESLHQAANELSCALDEPEAIESLLSNVVSSLEAHGAMLRMLNPDGDELLLAGARGLSETYLDKGPVQIATSQVDQRVLDGEVVVVPDVSRAPGYQYPEQAAAEGLRGMLAIPLMVRGNSIGVLRLYVDEVQHISQEAISMVSILADLGAIALERIRLHQSLYHIAQAINSSLELQPMMQQVLEATVREMSLKAASIRLLDPDKQVLRLVAAHGLSEAYLAKGEVHVKKSPVDQRALQGEVVRLYDIECDRGFEYPLEAAREGIRSVLVVSLRIKERRLGVMRAYSARPRSFGEAATGFLISVSDLVALAIQNAELYAALEARFEHLELDLAEWYRFLALG
jgi:GAF domain-containing protein